MSRLIHNLVLVGAIACVSLIFGVGSTVASTQVTISPSSLPAGTVGVVYSQTVSVSGPRPPYTVQVTQGSLPPGLSLSSAGALTGIPTTAGSFAFAISAYDSHGSGAKGTQNYTISIAGVTSTTTTISPSSLPGATVGVAYSQTISVSGPKPPYTVRVTQGSLPSGLSLSSAGALTGTPTTSGSFAFTVSAFDSGGTYVAFRDYTISIAGVTSTTTTISPSSLSGATVGVAYSQTISVSGPKPPYAVRVTQGTLPTGLSLSSAGALTGTPTTSGSFAFTVSAFDSGGTYVAFRDYTLSVAASATSGTTYFSDDFENGIISPWVESGASSLFSLVPGWTGQAVRLTNYGVSSGTSQMVALYLPNSPNLTRAYAGQDTWYHFKVSFPSNYQPTTGQWNWVAEWHIDGTTQSTCPGTVSTALSVYTDGPTVTNAYGQNPRLALRLAGGSCSSQTYQSIQLPSNSLLRGHWYDLVFHFVWSTSSTTGLAEWWVDGQQEVSTHFPTLFTRPDGSASTNSFGLYNYRMAANWTDSIDYDHVRIGSTQASVN